MQITVLKSKLHKATVKNANINYNGSITISSNLMQAVNLFPHEKVEIYDINNGARLTTYIIQDKQNENNIEINGAAAKLIETGDKVIICAYTEMDSSEIDSHSPSVAVLDDDNKILKIK